MKSVNSILNTVVVTFDTATKVIGDTGVILTNTASGLANLAQVGNVASLKLLKEQEQDMRSWEIESQQRCAEHALEAATKLAVTKKRIKDAVSNDPELASLLQESLEYLGISDKPATAK